MTLLGHARSLPADELLAALRLASPSLPIGAFAYSQGLEGAIERGWVTDRTSTEAWVRGLLRHAVARFDLPLLARLYDALAADDLLEAGRLDDWVLAGRGSAELQDEERHLGAALNRLLGTWTPGAPPAEGASKVRSYLGSFALAALRSGLARSTTMSSYSYAWIEHQLSAATRLIPLGQSDAQAALAACLADVGAAIEAAGQLDEQDIGVGTPGLAIASAGHETQRTRLFRS